MKFLIIADFFTGLQDWLLEDKDPKGMPAVYNLFQFLGNSKEHSFKAIIVNPKITRIINFPNGSKIYLKKCDVNNKWLFRLKSYYHAYILGCKFILENEFDVIYGMANYSIPASLLGYRYKKFTVNRVFGSLASDCILQKKYHKVFTRHILEYLTARFAKDILISTNDGTQYDELVKFAGRKLPFYHLYNGINRSFLKKLSKIRPIRELNKDYSINIISIGRLTYWKRHDLGIQTVYLLRKKYNVNANLVILGDGPDRNKLQGMIEEYGLTKHVVLYGSVAQQEYLNHLESAQIGLFCYDNSNLGNSLWETVFAGRLIAAKATGDTPNVIKNQVSGLLASENNFAEEMAKNINACLDIPQQEVSNWNTEARETVGKLVMPWDSRLKKELEIINSNLNTSR